MASRSAAVCARPERGRTLDSGDGKRLRVAEEIVGLLAHTALVAATYEEKRV